VEGVEEKPDTAAPSPRLWRSLLLGTVLAAVNALWVTMVEVRYYMLDGSCLPLFITPLFLLLFLVLINVPLHRLAPRIALRQEEMLIAYVMAVVSNTFAGHDMLQNFFGQVTHPYYFAPQNQWQDSFLSRLPPGLFVKDDAALKAWYRGNTSPEQAVGYLVHWSVPLTLWGIFFLLLVLLFASITVLFRKQWTENERLAFPIIQLPLAMTEPGGRLFKDRLMWIGFAIPFTIGTINGIAALYPSFPAIPYMKLFDVGQFFTTQPFEAIRTYGMQTNIYPFAIGLAYFIPLDLAFSCWFSYVFARAYFVFGRATGLDGPSAAQGWPFLDEISSGVWIGLAGAILWANSRYIAHAFDLAFDRTVRREIVPGSEEAVEARRYRGAFLAALLSGGLLIAWTYFLLNLAPLVSVAFFAILLALSLGITRIRAEFGTPHEIVFVKPAKVLVTVFGTQAIGTTNLIGMESMYWFNRGYRCHPMPNFLEAFKMGEGKNQRLMGFSPLLVVFTVAGVVSLLATYAANYFITYEAGAAGKAIGYKSWVGQEAFSQLDSWIKMGQPAGSTNLWYFAGGLFMAGLLAYLRRQFLWWPLHPAGFALGTSYAMNYFWMCVLIAWGAKWFIIRYGGMSFHRRVIPFFLGLILGDYTIGALWSLVGLLIQTPTYKIYI
jgi:hypothetical protein